MYLGLRTGLGGCLADSCLLAATLNSLLFTLTPAAIQTCTSTPCAWSHSASKPLLEQDREDDSDQQDSSHDPEDGSQGTSKANGVSYDPKVHKSMNAVTLESDHDFPMTAGLKRVLDSPAMATACCIFLCFILKTVQQVCRRVHFYNGLGLDCALSALSGAESLLAEDAGQLLD